MEYLNVGKIVNTHGIRGEVRVISQLAEDEYYYHQIIGLIVVDEDDKEIGKIKEILSPGANDVWVVQRKGKKDALIPYIASVVKEIDLANGIVKVELPEGLIDDED